MSQLTNVPLVMIESKILKLRFQTMDTSAFLYEDSISCEKLKMYFRFFLFSFIHTKIMAIMTKMQIEISRYCYYYILFSAFIYV